LTGLERVVGLVAAEDGRKYMKLVLELCEGGDLLQEIVSRPNYSEADAAKWCREMLTIVDSVHQSGYCHRDIKPENFLFKDKSRNILVIADLGLASKKPSHGQYFKNVLGTPCYMAPEAFEERANEKCDIWAVGCILYLMLSGRLPFVGHSEKGVMLRITSGNYDLRSQPWNKVSEEAKAFIRKIFVVDADRRASIEELLQDPWLTGMASRTPLNFIEILKQNLIEFQLMNKFKKAALLEIAKLTDAGRLDELKRTFKEFDLDGNGTIEHSEMEMAAKRLGYDLTEEEAKAIFKAYDIDGDGRLSYEEFIAAGEKQTKLITTEKLRETFAMYDADNSQTISIDELRQALRRHESTIDEEDVERIMVELDHDNSGLIDFDEFCNMFVVLNHVDTISRKQD